MNVRTGLLLLFLAALGCSSGGGGTQMATIAFPLEGAVADGDTIMVRGTTADSAAVAAVRVNGVDATSNDGFATWQAVLPLEPGINRFQVETEDRNGNVTPGTSVTIEWQGVLNNLNDIAFDAVRGLALLVDSGSRVIAVDVATGRVAAVYGGSRGAGEPLEEADFIVVAPGDRFAYLYDENRILRLDLETGDRTLVADPQTGTGEWMEAPSAFAIHPDGTRLFMTRNERFVAVEIATGNRTQLDDTGTGPALVSVRGMTIDGPGNRALVVSDDMVLAVDLATGDRTVLSDSPDFGIGSAGRGAYLASSSTLFVPDNSFGADHILAVDLSTGTRTLFSGPGAGSGPDFESPRDIVHDAARNRLLVTDSDDGHDAIVAVDLATGDRSELYRNGRGAGPFIDDPRDIALDIGRNRLAVADPGSGGKSVNTVDLATGDRAALSEREDSQVAWRFEGIAYDAVRDRFLATASGRLVTVDARTGVRSFFGDEVTSLWDIEIDAANDRALVISSSGILYAFDLASGDATELAGPTVGSGPELSGARELGLDLEGNRAFVRSEGQLVEIDLATGDRSVRAARKGDPELDGRGAMLVDRAADRLYYAGSRQILAIDLATGERTVFSGGDKGDGPQFGGSIEAIVRLPGTDIALVLEDSRINGVIAVDLVTGDRTVFSK